MRSVLWVGQKVRSGFSITSYRKTQTNILANPIFEELVGYRGFRTIESLEANEGMRGEVIKVISLKSKCQIV